MNITNKPKTQGFTIIEVVLVLAIAGLIFLIVFLALPALQRSQRDTQRKNDLSRFMSQLTQYQSNHQGGIPNDAVGSTTNWSAFVSAYLTNSGSTFGDPQSGSYTLSRVANSTAPSTTVGTVTIYQTATCSSGVPSGTGAGARDVAVTMALEQGGYLCQNN
jgi:prepilin-type N-terminal cleavage/methylation domain-containing protein